GGGFVGVHSATDTWYAVPEYRDLVGGIFDGHPWHQRVRILVEDRAHPATRSLGDSLELNDEIYQFRGWSRPEVHVLLRLDPRSVDVGRGKRSDGDYALAWSKSYGRGRVIYTSLGHEPAVWADSRFQSHLLGAIQWGLRGRLTVLGGKVLDVHEAREAIMKTFLTVALISATSVAPTLALAAQPSQADFDACNRMARVAVSSPSASPQTGGATGPSITSPSGTP